MWQLPTVSSGHFWKSGTCLFLAMLKLKKVLARVLLGGDTMTMATLRKERVKRVWFTIEVWSIIGIRGEKHGGMQADLVLKE